MKVLFITGEYPPMRGGIGDHVESLRLALAKLGISSAVLTSSQAQTRDGGAHSWPDIFPLVERWGFGSWPRIAETVKQEEADVVHLHYQTGAFALNPAVNLLPLWLRLRLGLPVVTTMHDLREPYIFPKAGRLRRLANVALVLSSSAVVATNSEDYCAILRMKAALPSFSKAHAESVFAIPLGTYLPPIPPDSQDRDQWRRDLGLQAENLVLCYFGILNRSKGVDTLLRAYRTLLDHGLSCRLLVLGEEVGSSDPTNSSYKQMVLTLTRELGVADKVVWTGYLPQERLTRALFASDMCILPYEDGASLRRTTLLTALAHGLPIITTTPSKAPSHVGPDAFPSLENRVNCLTVPPRSPQDIAEAVNRLLGDPHLRQRLASEGRSLAAELSWDKVGTKTAKVYRHIAATKKHALVHE